MPPEVLDAMAEAARHFVSIDELQEKVGKKIAEWTKNEAAYISCGAAAGLVLSTAACITGLDTEKRARLPYTEITGRDACATNMKNEVIVHKFGRVGYDFAIRQAGGKLVEIGAEEGTSPEDMEQAINEKKRFCAVQDLVTSRTSLLRPNHPSTEPYSLSYAGKKVYPPFGWWD